jgi:hypothetical protein
MARTNISVDRSVFEEFSRCAQMQNKTLFAFANESLATTSKICAEGGNPSDLYRMWRSISLLKQIDVITLPSEFVDDLIGRLYKGDREGTLKMFQELGASLVGLLKIIAKDIDGLAETAKDFMLILPVKSLKVTSGGQGEIEISIVGAGRRIESTQCTFEFVKSVLNGYGYDTVGHEIGIGTIQLRATRRSSY